MEGAGRNGNCLVPFDRTRGCGQGELVVGGAELADGLGGVVWVGRAALCLSDNYADLEGEKMALTEPRLVEPERIVNMAKITDMEWITREGKKVLRLYYGYMGSDNTEVYYDAEDEYAQALWNEWMGVAAPMLCQHRS